MASIGELVGKVSLDTSGVSTGAMEAGKSLDKLAGKFKAAGAALSLAFTAPVVLASKNFIQLASDAEETQNKFNQVFGAMADDANNFANELANSIGRFAPDIQTSLAAFQSMGIGFGLTSKEALSFSKDLSQLTIDFASFHNISDAESMDRFIAALSGSSEVLDQFGVNIKQGALDQKLLEMGFKTIGQGAEESEKAIARLEIIRDTMGKQGALGDALRTADSFANKNKKLNASWNEMGIKLGNKLLPIAEKFVDILDRLITAFSNLSPFVQNFILVLSGLLAVVGPLLVMVGFLINTLSFLGPILLALGAGPIGLIILAIIALIAVIAFLITHWDLVKEKIMSVVNWIVSFLKDNFQKILTIFFGPIGIAIGLLISNFERIKSTIWGVAESVKNTMSTMKDNVVGTFSSIITKIGEFFNKAKDAGSSLTKAIKDFLNDNIIDKFNGIQISVLGKNIGLPDIPRFATGGIVDSPSTVGDRNLIRVNGEEEVVTKNDRQTLKSFMKSLGGNKGSQAVNIYNSFDSSFSVEQVSNKIMQQIKLGY